VYKESTEKQIKSLTGVFLYHCPSHSNTINHDVQQQLLTSLHDCCLEQLGLNPGSEATLDLGLSTTWERSRGKYRWTVN